MSIRYDLELKGMEERLVVRGLRGMERIHQPWYYELVVETHDRLEWPLLEEVLGLEGTLRASPFGNSLTDEGMARLGTVLTAEVSDEGLRLGFGSRLWLSDMGQDYRVFVDLDAVEIAQQVLSQLQFGLEKRVERRLRKRPQCVQCWESPLRFISRLLAEEGIVFICDPAGTEQLILIDSPEGFHAHLEAPLTVRRESHLIRDFDQGDSVIRGVKQQRLSTATATQRDFNYENPRLDLLGQEGDPYNLRERYEFHGGVATREESKALARRRLEAYRAEAETLEFRTTCRTLSPGLVTEIEGDEDELRRRWLVIEVEHRGLMFERTESTNSAVEAPERDYEAQVRAVPAEYGYRLLDTVTRGTRTSLRTVTVMGPSGTEIHPDALGRVKIRHRWDRVRPEDDTASSWTRVIQPSLSGSMLLPRVGWEELMAHWGTGTDEPLALGRLVNAVAPPPNSLPANKVWSAFGTQSTPGGGPGNRIAFNDTDKSEGLHLNAGRDMSDKTANDKTTTVTAAETHTVLGNRDLITGQVHAVNVLGPQMYTVGSRKVAVDADKIINAASHNVTIGSLRTFSVGGMQSIQCSSLTRLVAGPKAEIATGGEGRTISGTSAVTIGALLSQTVGGPQSVNVSGVNAETVGGPKSINSKGAYSLNVRALTETYGARTLSGNGVHFDYGSTMDIKSGGTQFKGSEVVFKATSGITIKAGGATIRITPSSVTIDAQYKNSSAAKDSDTENYG